MGRRALRNEDSERRARGPLSMRHRRAWFLRGSRSSRPAARRPRARTMPPRHSRADGGGSPPCGGGARRRCRVLHPRAPRGGHRRDRRVRPLRRAGARGAGDPNRTDSCAHGTAAAARLQRSTQRLHPVRDTSLPLAVPRTVGLDRMYFARFCAPARAGERQLQLHRGTVRAVERELSEGPGGPFWVRTLHRDRDAPFLCRSAAFSRPEQKDK